MGKPCPVRVSDTTVEMMLLLPLKFKVYGEGNGEVLLRALCIAQVRWKVARLSSCCPGY